MRIDYAGRTKPYRVSQSVRFDYARWSSVYIGLVKVLLEIVIIPLNHFIRFPYTL